jgi:diguanylate cyclase (GGDEF)-like protein
MQKIAILYDASQAVLSTFELDEVLTQILAIARDYFRLQSGAILLRDEVTGNLVVKASFGMGDEPLPQLQHGRGLCGEAVKLKRPICVPDVSKDSRYVAGVPTTQSEIAIPLIVRDEVVGVIDCQSSELNFFDSETVDLLTLFATQASIGIQNALLYSLLQRRAAQLEVINAIAKQTTAVLEMGDLLRKTSELILKAFPLEDTAILLSTPDEHMVLRAHAGKLQCKIADDQTVPDTFDDVLQCLASRHTARFSDALTDARHEKLFEGAHSEIFIPLISFGTEIGVLACASTRSDAFQENEVKALESVADIIATAIQNVGHVEQIRQLAFRDGLTGIFNRRYFEQKMREELDRATRYEEQLSVLMIDIDHFKEVNDEYGHLLGDEVLRQVSNLFTTQLRKVDFVCRYGGEEFATLMPSTPGEKALQVAEKLRRKIAGWHFPGVQKSITVSIGVAEYPEHGETRDSLVRAADAALYLAKQKGRNRVQSASLSALAPSSND